MPLNFSTGRKPLTAFSLASLTDIVLLLLIFFLLTSSFVTQRGLRVELPDTASATPLESRYVSVSILPDGRLFVDETETSPDSLTATIESLRGERDAVAVYADREALVGALAAVAGAAAELDMRVSVATDPGAGN